MCRCLFTLAVFLATLEVGGAEKFLSTFSERAKCAVSVKYTLQLEEERRQITACAMVADSGGLLVVPSSEIPAWARVESIRDFKVFVFNGDALGYSADYLGMDPVSGTHFLRLQGGLPDTMVPFSVFKRAKVEISQELWGVSIASEDDMFEPYYTCSYVSKIGRRPMRMGDTGGCVASVGAPIFDRSGNFVGWGLSQSREEKIILYENSQNGKNGKVVLVSPSQTSTFLFPEELDEILKRIPKNPMGDPRAWAGFVDMQILKPDVAKIVGLDGRCAIVVSGVVKDSPAQKAGIKKGDIIIGMNGSDIERLSSNNDSLENFWMKLSGHRIGDKVSFSILRGTEPPKIYEVSLGERPKTLRQSCYRYFRRLGFSVREFLLDDAIERRMLSNDKGPAIVQFVKPNSPASSAMPCRLAIGDIIKEINSKPVSSYAEIVEILTIIESDTSVKDLVILAEDFRETKVIRIKMD